MSASIMAMTLFFELTYVNYSMTNQLSNASSISKYFPGPCNKNPEILGYSMLGKVTPDSCLFQV